MVSGFKYIDPSLQQMEIYLIIIIHPLFYYFTIV